MKKNFCTFVFAIATACMAFSASPRTVYLYHGVMPNENGYTAQDEYMLDGLRIYKTANPRIDLYMPALSADAAPAPVLLCCPGGAYVYTSCDNEGVHVAEFFTARGWAVAVLKYRMPNGHTMVPLTDACRAMEMLRDSAQAWHLDGQNIGVIGFSAGGHLASTLVTQFTNEKTRPDFGILVYPVISMDDAITHQQTCHELLGDNPSDDMRQAWSSDKRVTAATPPCFLVACQDDKAVPVENSIRMYQGLTQADVPAEMILLPKGNHGFGFTRQFPERETFEGAMMTWLMRQVK